jgi:hypothetical protein
MAFRVSPCAYSQHSSMTVQVRPLPRLTHGTAGAARLNRWNLPARSPFHALAVNDGCSRTGIAYALIAALKVERVLDAIERI